MQMGSGHGFDIAEMLHDIEIRDALEAFCRNPFVTRLSLHGNAQIAVEMTDLRRRSFDPS